MTAMSARTYPGSLVAFLVILACSGWVAAWRAGNSPAPVASGKDSQGAAGNSRARSPRGQAHGTPVSSLVKDPATARLLASFDEIAAAARPGEVNEKLIEACRGSLLDNDIGRRGRNFGMLLELMRAEDAPALQKLFADLHREGRAFEDYKAFAMRWGMVDAPAALAHQRDVVSKGLMLPPDDFRAVARGWGKVDPAGALRWMEENPEIASGLGGRTAVVQGWLKTEPENAIAWIAANREKMMATEYYEMVRMGFTEQLFSSSGDLLGAADWLVGLADAGGSSQAWNDAQWTLTELDSERAAEVWGKVGGQPWMYFGQFDYFSRTISSNGNAEQGMEGFLEALNRHWPEDKITTQFDRWAERNPDKTLEWLSNAPPGDFTRKAVRGALQGLQRVDPSRAAEWEQKLQR